MDTVKKEQSTHASAAKAIRKELKEAFPLIAFSVRSSVYSGGSSVRIDWVDGPISDEVRRLVGKYQYGHFNGQEDIYENTNSREDIPQVKYVQVSRAISGDISREVFNLVKKTHAGWENVTSLYEYNAELQAKWRVNCAWEYILGIVWDKDLTHGFKGIKY